MNEQIENIRIEPQNVETIKKLLISLLELSELEKTAIKGIRGEIMLTEFLNEPECCLTEKHVTELKELLELIDLIGGVYLA